MSDLLKSFGPWAVYLLASAWLLKYLVTNKLETIQKSIDALAASISDHDERIRDLETSHAELIGGLRAKGCLEANGTAKCGR